MSTVSYNKILSVQKEAKSSLANVRKVREKWQTATQTNPTNLTKKEIDHLSKDFKNKILALKWDCEDLEEVVSCEDDTLESLGEIKQFIGECRDEMTNSMNLMEEYESGSKIYNKHGINTLQNQSPTLQQAAKPVTVTSITQNPILQNEQLTQSTNTFDKDREIQHHHHHFDKNQVDTSSATIFNNALYDHLEGNNPQESLVKGCVNTTEVFNNLTRPADVYTNSNENEMILEMLETEYYNPPAGLLAKSRYNDTVRKLFETDRNKFLGTIALIFSFPILLVLFLVI